MAKKHTKHLVAKLDRFVLFSSFINNTEQELYSDKYHFLYTVKFSLLQNTAYV